MTTYYRIQRVDMMMKVRHDDENIQCKLVLYMVHKLFVYTFFLVGLLAYIARNQTLLYACVCIYYS
jgi:hypothetical protein